MKLSIILSGRDDEYGSLYIERFSKAWGDTIQNLKDSNLDFAIIFTDYNPIGNYIFKHDKLNHIFK